VATEGRLAVSFLLALHAVIPLALTKEGSEVPRVFAGYGFVSPSNFASWASSILVGRNLGRVQFFKRCGTTA
jgi:hypothetical protein